MGPIVAMTTALRVPSIRIVSVKALPQSSRVHCRHTPVHVDEVSSMADAREPILRSTAATDLTEKSYDCRAGEVARTSNAAVEWFAQVRRLHENFPKRSRGDGRSYLRRHSVAERERLKCELDRKRRFPSTIQKDAPVGRWMTSVCIENFGTKRVLRASVD